MLGVVISLNIAISLVCLLVVWRIWRLKQVLTKIANTLLSWERSTHNTLYRAPKHILLGKKGIANLQRQHAQLQFHIKQVQQILALFFLLQRIFRQQNHGFNRHPPKP